MTKLAWVLAAITMGCVTLAGTASACPTGNTDFAQPPRPRPIQQVSTQTEASQLIVRASELDAAAGTRERSALAFDQEADTLASRARTLRNQAQLVSLTSDRENILEIVDELVARASIDRTRASNERARASELRLEARNLRDRATQLVRVTTPGGGGWRGPRRSAASEGVTL